MQLSEQTLNILKNFAGIQKNIFFDGTDTIKTIAEARNVTGSAKLDTYPDRKVGIYDLSEFLATLTLVANPKLSFKDDFILIEDQSGRSRIKYFYTDEKLLTYPTKDYALPSVDIKFVLDADTLSRLKKAAATLGHDKVAIKPSGAGTLELSIVDLENKTSNMFSIDIAGEFEADADFSMVFDINNFKMVPGDYDIEISQKLISKLTNKAVSDLHYFVALDKASEYS